MKFASAEEVDSAVAAAKAAFSGWRDTSLAQRTQILFRLRDLLDARAGELAEIVTAEHGKVSSDAAGEVARGQEVARLGEVVRVRIDTEHRGRRACGGGLEKAVVAYRDIAVDRRIGNAQVSSRSR